MKHEHLIVQRPGNVAQLFLLFHGQGESPAGMGNEIGSWFAQSFPQAMVVSIGAPQPCGPGDGRQWYSAHDLADNERKDRVDAVMPYFVNAVREWQLESGAGGKATALIGFSQGSIMALEAVKQHPQLAARVVAFSGRFAALPEKASRLNTIHLIHGDDDHQVPLTHALAAEERLTALGGDVTLDIIEDLPHAIDQRGMERALHHLHNTIPRRYFDEALSGSTPGDNDVVTFI